MKKSVALLFCLVMSMGTWAQIFKPTTWSAALSVKEAKIGDVIEVVISAKIDTEWYVYSNDFDPNAGPNLTSFEFKPNGTYQLVGKVQAVGAKKKFDKIWEAEVSYFEKVAEFRQKVKVLKEGFKVEGVVTFQACSDVKGTCLPPEDVDWVAQGLKVSAAPADELLAGKASPAPDSVGSAVAPPRPDTTSTALADSVAPANGGASDSTSIASATEGELAPVAQEQSLLGFFFAAFVSGLLALLTPCVFPMIPMTVSFFLKNSTSRAEAITKGIVFGLSIITIFVTIGIVFSLLFGADAANILATHWLPNLIFFLIFFVFALSFFGMFDIVLPSSLVNKIDAKSEQGGYAGVFFMAFTLALVSFSCTGPIAGSVLVQAAGGQLIKPVVGMLGFSAAFALPFSLFAIFPNWLQGLPKSGGWLNVVKVVLGFVELALSLKFLSVVDQVYHWGLLDRHVYIAIWLAIAIGLGLYLLGQIRLPHDSPSDHIGVPRLLLAIVAFSFAVYLLPGMFGAPLKALAGYLPPQTTHGFDVVALLRAQSGTVQAANQEASGGRFADRFKMPHGLRGYYDFQEGLAAAKKLNKPIFIDFTGHGCVNCREMEANVWSSPEVLRRLQNDFVIIALYVDDPLELPEAEWVTSTYDGKVKKTIGKINADFQIARFNNNAQPYYVLLNPVDASLTPLVKPVAYDLNVNNFVKFLDQGIANFKARQKNTLSAVQ